MTASEVAVVRSDKDRFRSRTVLSELNQTSNENPVGEIILLSSLPEAGKVGLICVRISSVSESLKSRNGWQYRKMNVEDSSMHAEALVSEEKYQEWKFKRGDHVICSVRSNGLGSDGHLSLFYNDFLGPFETARIMYNLEGEIHRIKTKAIERMKPNETVYQISAREARSLMELIKLWVAEQNPQHYTKWCQMHQIVATNLYYMGLVKRTGSMSGYYYPTEEALEFFKGTRSIPKKRVFVKDKEGKHVLASDEGESRSFVDYLNDHADRESSLREYKDALRMYQERVKAGRS